MYDKKRIAKMNAYFPNSADTLLFLLKDLHDAFMKCERQSFSNGKIGNCMELVVMTVINKYWANKKNVN